MNRFISRVCISPGHAASFMGVDKLYRMVKNHFPIVTRKEIRNMIWYINNQTMIWYINKFSCFQ